MSTGLPMVSALTKTTTDPSFEISAIVPPAIIEAKLEDSMAALGLAPGPGLVPTPAISTPTASTDSPIATNDEPFDKDGNVGKLFVGGLSWETSKEGMQEYFEKYGEVTECVIMTDPHTGRSRGFGFVTFADAKIAKVVTTSGPHNLDNRKIDPKPAIFFVPRGSANQSRPPPRQHQNRDQFKTKKIFVGGLNPETTQEGLTAFFNDFGVVENVVLMYDRETKRPRGFGFVTFTSEEPVLKLCAMHFVELNGKTVEIKMAQPKTSPDGINGMFRRGGNRPFNNNNRGQYNERFAGQNYPQGFNNSNMQHGGYNQFNYPGYNGQRVQFGNFDMPYQNQNHHQQGFMPMQYYEAQQFGAGKLMRIDANQQQQQQRQQQQQQQQHVEFAGKPPGSIGYQPGPASSGSFPNYAGAYHTRGFAMTQNPAMGLHFADGPNAGTSQPNPNSVPNSNGDSSLTLGFLPADDSQAEKNLFN